MYNVRMNRLSTEQRGRIVGCLVEGMSIRATVRVTGAAKNTVGRRSLFRVSGRGTPEHHLQTRRGRRDLGLRWSQAEECESSPSRGVGRRLDVGRFGR